MALHPPVLFIGDRPNVRKNLDMNTPFVGTTSYKTLLEWIYLLNLDVNLVSTANAYRIDGQENNDWVNKYDRQMKVVALGSEAATRLRRFNEFTAFPFFELPHPSGRNTKLNDKVALAKQLTACRKFIHGL